MTLHAPPMPNVLLAPPGSAWWLAAAADAVLLLHIAGGSTAIVSGAVALVARKGGRTHRVAGTAFFAAMIVMATIGAVVAPFLGQPSSSIAGALTLYLVVTGWLTARRRDSDAGWLEMGGFVAALGVAGTGAYYVYLATHSPTGTVEDQPPEAFYLFLIVGAIAAASDLKVILRGRIGDGARLARHLWRMCTALFIAAGSFFLGQEQVMPRFIQGSPLLFVPEIAILALLVFWMIRVRLGRRNAAATA